MIELQYGKAQSRYEGQFCEVLARYQPGKPFKRVGLASWNNKTNYRFHFSMGVGAVYPALSTSVFESPVRNRRILSRKIKEALREEAACS